MPNHAAAALKRAILLADARRVRHVLEHHGGSLVHQSRHDYGRLPLAAALCTPGVSAETLELLLDAGADPNRAFADECKTPLHLAVHSPRHRGTRQVAILLRHGADPQRPDARGTSALEYARAEGRDDLVEMMRIPMQRRCLAERSATSPAGDPGPTGPGL